MSACEDKPCDLSWLLIFGFTIIVWSTILRHSNLVNIIKICCVCIRRNRKFRVPSMTRWFRFRIFKPTRNFRKTESVYNHRKILPWACLKIKECTESWPWILGDLSGHGWNGGREWHFNRCWSCGSTGQCELLGARVSTPRSSCH